MFILAALLEKPWKFSKRAHIRQKFSENETLKFSGVSKILGKRKIQDNLSFTIQNLETVALIGSNGSGKSSVINLAVGFLHPDEGQVGIRDAHTIGKAREQIRLC
jgi:ABC-type multidrug transport system ATPase subunit